MPGAAHQLLVHVRDYTKGHPSIAANNHPVRHGPVVGIHNGIIVNDDEVLEPYNCARAEPRMTVDSEAIFALAAHSERPAGARRPPRRDGNGLARRAPAGGRLLARGVGRPLWLGEGRNEAFFASTRAALEVVERYCGVRLRKHEVREGTLLTLKDGAVVRRDRFRPDLEFTEADPLPAVRAPGERDFCLMRLAALAMLG